MADITEIRNLKKKANELRKRLITLSYKTGVLHLGGDLSSSDILTVLYQYQLKYDLKNPKWEDRDRMIMSKGHGGAVLYAAQSMAGFYDMEEIYRTYRQVDSRFGMHPCSNVLDTLDVSSGSLGHGLSLGIGFALAGRLNNRRYRVYVLLGDGETDEGSVWEAIMAAPNFKLGSMVAIVDRNRMSLDGFTEDSMALEPYADKWRAFNWNVVEIDGNNIAQICDAFDALPDSGSTTPTVIIANTIKGKGIDFMENNIAWHSGVISNQEMYQNCICQLDEALKKEIRG